MMDSNGVRVTQGYKQKLQQYEAAFAAAIHQQYPLSNEACQELQQLQQALNLSHDAVASIEKHHTAPLEAEHKGLQQYKEVFAKTIHRQYPLSSENHEFLANLRRVLNLSEETAQAIEKQMTQGYEGKLQQYKIAFTKAIYQQYPLSDLARQQLQQLQQNLHLKQDVINSIEADVTQGYEEKLQQYEEAFTQAIQRQRSPNDEDHKSFIGLQQGFNLTEPVTQGHEGKSQQYKIAFTKAIYQQYPLSDLARQQLQQLQQNLHLKQDVINSIEADVTQGYEEKLQQYEEAFTQAIQRQYLLDDESHKFLENFQRVLNSNQRQAAQGHKQKLQQYDAAFTVAIYQQYPLSNAVRQLLKQLQQQLELKHETTQSIEADVTQGYEEKLQQYEEAFNQAIQRQYPLSGEDREFLDYLRRGLNLSQKITESIEELENFRRVLGLREEVTDSIEAKVIEAYTLHPSQPTNAPLRREIRQPWLKATLVTVTFAGVIGAVYAYSLWHQQAERTMQVALERAETLKDAKKYEACMNQAGEVPQRSHLYTDAQNLVNQCQHLAQDQTHLAQAKALAAKYNFQAAIPEATKIGSDSSLHQEAQGLVGQWSENLLKQAEAQYKHSSDFEDLQQAIGLTKVIPQTSSAAKEAEKMTQQWQAEWSQNETYAQEAEAALDQRQWQGAITKADQVRVLGQKISQETPYWQNKMQPIIARANELEAASHTQESEITQPISRTTARQSTTRQSVTRQSATRPPIRSSAARRTPTQPSKTQQSSRQAPTSQPAPKRSGSSGWTVEQE